MGDWERTFGAGTSAESVIGGINRGWQQEQDDAWWEAKRRSTPYDRAPGEEMYFSSLDEADAWIKANPGANDIQRPKGTGYVMKVIKGR